MTHEDLLTSFRQDPGVIVSDGFPIFIGKWNDLPGR